MASWPTELIRIFKAAGGNNGIGDPELVDPYLFAEPIRITGGVGVQLINDTGSASVKGTVVEMSANLDDAVDIAAANATDPVGVILDDGVADGEIVTVMVSGYVQVLVGATPMVRKDRLVCGPSPGAVIPNNTPSATDHWKEVGHAGRSAAASTLVWAMIHFN